MSDLLIAIFIFVCWGSFLNVVAHRLIIGKTLGGRSQCPHCQTRLAWFDLIPIFSFVWLGGKCRTCHGQISWLYPALEIFTPLVLTMLYLSSDYFVGYFIFFSALIVIMRTDLEFMLISPLTTLALIPLGIALSFLDAIPIEPINSIISAGIGFFSLWSIGFIFKRMTGQEGIGHGDFDLFALIGSFTGLFGLWFTLLAGSLTAAIIGIGYLLATGGLRRNVAIPFGPFLALGAIMYVLCQDYIFELLLGSC